MAFDLQNLLLKKIYHLDILFSHEIPELHILRRIHLIKILEIVWSMLSFFTHYMLKFLVFLKAATLSKNSVK